MDQTISKKQTIIFICLSIVTILFAFFIALKDRHEQLIENENITSDIVYQKDLMYRKWVSKQGGVYVPISEHTPPNPYLIFINNRDVITTNCDTLTLVNPAYMTRQVLEVAKGKSGLYGHLVSLKPINPINKPDAWENEALLAFEKGDTISSTFEIIDGIEYFRVIRPFTTEQSCLKCHEHQGYEIGDVRGGLSIYVPVKGFRRVFENGVKRLIISYSAILLIVVLTIVFIMSRFSRQERARAFAEERLKESEIKYRRLFTHMAEGFAIHELIYDSGQNAIDYKILTINSAFEKIINIPEEKIQGALATQLYGVSSAPYLDIYSKVVETGLHQSFETYFHPLKKHFEISVFSPGEGLFATIFTDITVRKNAEESLKESESRLIKLNATKDKLFSIIAHDLKGPLNSVLGLSGLLIEKLRVSDIEKSKKFASAINASSKSSIHLLDNLLTWGKTQTEQVKIIPYKIELHPVVEETLLVLNLSASLKHIKLVSSLPADLTVYADRDVLSLILRNLIANAIKFSNSGGTVDVCAISKLEHVEISVEDNGVGISEENKKRLFGADQYFTLLGTENEKGSGLGLILCKEFVTKLQGKIWVESELGKGSKFVFTLPILGKKSPISE